MDVVHLFLNSVISMFITLGRLRLNSFFILKMYSMLIGVNSAASSVIRSAALVRPMISTPLNNLIAACCAATATACE